MTLFTAAEYANASVLATEVAQRMLSRLDIVRLQPKVILDAGCTVGQGTALLKQYYPNAQVLAMESALPLLHYANEQQAADWVNAEAEQLPLKDHSVDLIFANLLLPWCDDAQKIFYEWRRVLRPEGLLMFSSLGPDTLQELRGKLFSLTAPKFVDMHDVGDMLTQAGWMDPVMDIEYITMTYRESEKLIRELQVVGMIAHDEVPVQLEKNEANVYPITFEVVYGHAWGPGVAKGFKADDEGVARIPLAHLRRQR